MNALALPSEQDIRQYARGALVAADALETTPAPLGEIAAAAGLLPAQDLFDLGEEAPPGLLAVIRKFRGRVLGALALSERTVYLDSSLAAPRRDFTHAHEIGHRSLPWHRAAYLTDGAENLRSDTRDLLEQEANAFAAEILFGLDRFTEQADTNAPGLAGPLELAQTYGTSAHATLRRYVQCSRRQLGLLALGRIESTLRGRRALVVIPGQCAQSASFAARYGPVHVLAPRRLSLDCPAVALAAEVDRGLSPERSELTIDDSKRGAVRFDAEVFDNGRLRFVLLYRRQPLSGRRLRAATGDQARSL